MPILRATRYACKEIGKRLCEREKSMLILVATRYRVAAATEAVEAAARR